MKMIMKLPYGGFTNSVANRKPMQIRENRERISAANAANVQVLCRSATSNNNNKTAYAGTFLCHFQEGAVVRLHRTRVFKGTTSGAAAGSHHIFCFR